MTRKAYKESREAYKLKAPPFTGPVCPRCQEINALNSEACAHCHARLTPERRR